ncbi:UPF0746 protein DDB_G0281095-like [Aphis gossypii]|uniref:UPF0746 protein DDB_G0281095-like n=1 Tax=Aphis gossypii TaxID=80765 RepID=UPI002158C153|nr:UPF0746 protein DDB_G0281095-like [Aphis gossypii]XP_050061297.1 UPF0746 protein DDB_G0281095-like [Aphis gossypii]
MALRDHDYVIPANHEEVGVPNLNLFLQDHNYAQRPAIQIQEEQEEDQQQQQQEDQPQAEGEDQPQAEEGEDQPQAEEQEDQPQAEEQEENQPQEEGEEEQQQQARTYRTIPGIRLNSKFYVDNFGYKYYKKKLLINRITLVCERQKNPNRPICHGSASISRNEMDNQILIVVPHNHEPN